MKRRIFLRNSALGGFSLSTLGFGACQSPSAESTDTPAKNNSETSSEDNFELNEITLLELQKQMEEGSLTARSIAEKYLARIEALDKDKLNSVIEINPDALTIADQMDQERKDGKVRGPLHGIPVMIKDNINTADKMMTTAGALALEGNIVSEDAFLVKKLREAGAILLGKTNLSEWANFRSTRSSSGWSSRGGQTRNPYILDRNPCGSSSGSGAAVSGNLCALTIGTETNGSIVCPSSTNGVVGIKPTVGLISRTGVIPISFSQDTAGPMARTVEDAAIFLGALTGVDPKDEKTQASEGKAETDYSRFLDAQGLKGAKIGVMRSAMGFHEEVDKLMEAAFEIMKKQGATLVDVEVIENRRQVSGPGYQVLLYEFKDGVNKYLADPSTNCKMKTLADVIEFNKQNAEKAMPYFKQEILESAQEKGDLNSQEYLDAVKLVQSRSREGIDNTLKENQLDAIIAPTGGPAWCIDVINGDNFGGGSSSPAAWSGYPNITVPNGFINNLPVGISFFGGAFSEPTLIKLAYAYEQASKHRKAPTFMPSLHLNADK